MQILNESSIQCEGIFVQFFSKLLRQNDSKPVSIGYWDGILETLCFRNHMTKKYHGSKFDEKGKIISNRCSYDFNELNMFGTDYEEDYGLEGVDMDTF